MKAAALREQAGRLMERAKHIEEREQAKVGVLVASALKKDESADLNMLKPQIKKILAGK